MKPIICLPLSPVKSLLLACYRISSLAILIQRRLCIAGLSGNICAQLHDPPHQHPKFHLSMNAYQGITSYLSYAKYSWREKDLGAGVQWAIDPETEGFSGAKSDSQMGRNCRWCSCKDLQYEQGSRGSRGFGLLRRILY
jgi:hypothetical protein